jgi:hypothetical protein
MKQFTGQLTEIAGNSSIANGRTKIPVIFRGIFGNSRDILKLLYVSRRRPIALIGVVLCHMLYAFF